MGARVRWPLTILLYAAGSVAQTVIPPKIPERPQVVASVPGTPLVQEFPNHPQVGIAVWGLPPTKRRDNISEIVVFRLDRRGEPHAIWRSELESTYAPTIEFVPGIVSEGLPVGIVFQQFGAAWGEIELVGRLGGHIARLQRLMCTFYETKRLESDGPDDILCHVNSDILDIPYAYRWNGRRLVDVSTKHPDFYRDVLREDEKEPYEDWGGGLGLYSLAQIAGLAGDRIEETRLLRLALAHELVRGREKDPETLRWIGKKLQSLGIAPPRQ